MTEGGAAFDATADPDTERIPVEDPTEVPVPVPLSFPLLPTP